METFADHEIYLPDAASGNTLTLCPQCSHTRKKTKDKCLSVHVEEGKWLCHHPHCGWSGKLKGNGLAGSQKPPEQLTKKKPSLTQGEELSEEAITFLQERYIGAEAVEVAKLWDERGYIKFPYYYKGRIVNVKSRGINSKKFFSVEGGERVLYGMDVALQSGSDTLIWVEGEIDVLSLYSCGISNVVSVPDGAPSPSSKNYQSKFDFLSTCHDFLSKFSQHILAVDGDKAGEKLRDELKAYLGAEKCREVIWPDECKDANDVLQNFDSNRLKDVIGNARYARIDSVVFVSDLRDKVAEIYKSGNPSGVSTGFIGLDPLYTILPDCLTLLTGIPSHGKSEWLDAVMVNVAQKEHWKFLVCSPESHPVEQHIIRLAAKYIGKPFDDIKGHDRMSEAEAEVAMAWINKYFNFISPKSTEDLNIEKVISIAEMVARRERIHGLVVDPWGDMIQQRINGMNETQYVSESLLRIRQFSRRFSVHVFLVAHPRILQRNEDGTYPIPGPYDISGSAHFRNKSDAMLCVWRDDTPDAKDESSYIHVQKVKNRRVGRIGVVKLTFDKPTGRYISNVE